MNLHDLLVLEQEYIGKDLYYGKKTPNRFNVINYLFHFMQSPEAFFHAVNLYDLFILRNPTMQYNCYDLGRTLTWISMKFYDNTYPTNEDFLGICHIEKDILQSIHYVLHFPTIHDILQMYIYIYKIDSFQRDVAYVLAMASTYKICNVFKPSTIAKASIMLSYRLLHRSCYILSTSHEDAACIRNLIAAYKKIVASRHIDHYLTKTYALLHYVSSI
jgi:hypothetical protein